MISTKLINFDKIYNTIIKYYYILPFIGFRIDSTGCVLAIGIFNYLFGITINSIKTNKLHYFSLFPSIVIKYNMNEDNLFISFIWLTFWKDVKIDV